MAPLTAVELLIELHKMEGEMVKPSIEAIKLCLNEKSVFTFEGDVITINRINSNCIRRYSIRLGD